MIQSNTKIHDSEMITYANISHALLELSLKNYEILTQNASLSHTRIRVLDARDTQNTVGMLTTLTYTKHDDICRVLKYVCCSLCSITNLRNCGDRWPVCSPLDNCNGSDRRHCGTGGSSRHSLSDTRWYLQTK